MSKQHRSFSTEFTREADALVPHLAEERGRVTSQSKALTTEQQKIQALEAKVARLEREKAI